MILTNKEYFFNPYYFFLKEKENKLSLYFSVGKNLNESRKKDDRIDFEKKDESKVKKTISNILKSKKAKTKDQVKKYFEPISTNKSEIEELINMDGTMNNSKIPPLDMGLHPRKTTDQTVVAARMTMNPVTRGYRKYYGESIEGEETNIKEIDYSDAFGYEETKDMNGKQTYSFLKKKMGMNSDEAKDRTKQFGKDPTGERLKNTPKNIRNKKNFIDRMTLSELEKNKMMKVVEDILLNKKNSQKELEEKDEKISPVLKKNISVLKKMADKEGLTLSQLIKLIKSE